MRAAHLAAEGTLDLAARARSERGQAEEGGENERWGGGRGAKGLASCKGRWLYNCEFGG